MRKLPVLLLLFVVLACNKDDDPEKFTSINGYWIVRTPDDATEVTFRISQDSDNQYVVEAENVFVKHDGRDYNSKEIDAGISVPNATGIESITLVVNSPSPPFFVIRFQEISVNSDFTEMQINISSFNIDGTFRAFPMIMATRD